ncbi:S-layer homology domain-containing protein [Longirhabdus pacifica]|uniref:S-layer homology domain-containing protein n=1 Tax=Longirhabdus pacifica TaxID=2305227 RepID=UPI0013E8B8C4|nr:S-layer homology domain-containing protein [Longirhabdus pacifica]
MKKIIVMTLLLFTFSTLVASANFNDVSEHWAKAHIDWAVSEGYISGYPDGTFRPDATITRAEFTSILKRVSDLEVSNKQSSFTDITNHWAKDEVMAAVAAGVIVENEYGTAFQPDTPISRLEIAKMIARALAIDEKYKTLLDSFKSLYNGDLPLIDYREFKQDDVPHLAMVFGARIMNGYPDSSFRIEEKATRAEATTMLHIYHTAKNNTPENYQYLNEMEEVALYGTNAQTISNLERAKNIQTDNMTLDHNNYTATLKRAYIIPIKGDIVSMYERKFLWDRSNLEDRYLNADAYVIGVADVTFKKDGGRSLYFQSLMMYPSSAFGDAQASKQFDFIFPWMYEDVKVKKNSTYEIVLYGSMRKDYNSSDFNVGENQIYILSNLNKGTE